MILVYVAHPIKPAPGETIQGNVAAAGEYLRAMLAAGVSAIASYLYPLDHGWEYDDDPAQRERAIKRGEEIARRCDAVVLCGPRFSDGMHREGDACGFMFDCTGAPPGEAAQAVADWIADGGFTKEGARNHFTW